MIWLQNSKSELHMPGSRSHSRNVGGFTLIELVMVIILIGILAAVSLSTVGNNFEATRYEETRSRMDAIRTAILGTTEIDLKGQRSHFGYHGDWGKLPSSLSELTTSQAPTWTFSSTYGTGSGWRGPYLKEGISGETFTQDAWGKNFIYAPLASPPSLTSYGSDGVAGGVVYGKDLVFQFPTFDRLSTLHGFVADADTRLPSKTVEVRYPVNGVLTAFTTTTDAQGYFTFPNVPFGVRSLAVTNAPALPPRQLTVDNSYYQVAASSLNYFGSLQNVTYIDGSVDTGAPGNSTVTATLKSTYVNDIQADYITVGWVRGGANQGYLNEITLNGVTQTIPNISSNTRFDITVTQTLPANSATNSLRLYFRKEANGTENINMENVQFSITFEWTASGEKDTITILTPN